MAPISSDSSNFQLQNCLQDIVNGLPTDSLLESLLLAHPSAAAFDITSANVEQVVGERSRLLHNFYPKFEPFSRDRLGSIACPLSLLWYLWLPLSQQLANQRRQLKHLLVQGILGGQGTGKTTLATILTLILEHLGYRVCSLSLDDLYKTYAERLQLQQTDPRLRWRGPPGTHDIELGLNVFQQLRSTPVQPVLLPRFDKSAYQGAGDRTEPEWVTGIDIILFEGWFVGMQPIDPKLFDKAPPPVCTAADRDFARDCNARLAAYLPLWQQIDQIMVLLPSDYCFSQQWRQQAEQQMQTSGRLGMSDAEIAEFVKYFWRSLHPDLFIRSLLEQTDTINLVIEINADHLPEKIYRPPN
jgi:D-glycerate 3-kinase